MNLTWKKTARHFKLSKSPFVCWLKIRIWEKRSLFYQCFFGIPKSTMAGWETSPTISVPFQACTKPFSWGNLEVIHSPFNMEPENDSFQTESSIPGFPFSGSFRFHVKLWEGISGMQQLKTTKGFMYRKHSRKLTANAPENRLSQMERIVFQSSIFRCEKVSFREGNMVV